MKTIKCVDTRGLFHGSAEAKVIDALKFIH